MAEQRTYQGHVYQRNAPGEPWVLVGPATPRPVTVSAGDPNAPAKSAADAEKAAADAASAKARAPFEGVTAAAQAREAVAKASEAEAKSSAAVKEQANAPDPAMSRVQKSLQTDAVLEAINRARSQIGEGWSTGNFAGTKGFQSVPFVGQNSANLSATLSGIQGSIINDIISQLKAMSSNGSSGYGSLTETEADRLANSVAAISQTQSSDQLLASLAQVEKHYRNALALLNNEDPRDPKVAERYGVLASPATSASGDNAAPGTSGGLTAEGKFVPDPALAGANAKVREMVLAGRSTGEIRAYLNALRPGLGAQVTDLDRAVAAVRQNPNQPIGVDLEKVWRPNSGFTRTMGNVGMGNSPLGGVGPALIGAADTASFGTLDNFTDDPAMARAAMGGVEQVSPRSYLLGELLGGASTGLGLEWGAGKMGLAGLRAARAGDLAYGAGYGAGTADDPGDNRVAAALLGGVTGLAGGAAGRGASRVAGRAISGVSDPAVRYLHERGVRMTPGQILGGKFKATEDRLAGLPLVGDTIRARRSEGGQDFNRAGFDEGLAPIDASTGGVTGAPGIDIARDLRAGAYDAALNPVQVVADAPFTADMGQAIAAGNRLPEPMRTNIQYTLPTRVGESFGPNGELSGRAYQQVLRGLRRDANSVSSLPYGYDFGQVTNQAENALEGLIERQSPGTVGALRTANEVNRNVETLRDAVNRARNGSRSGETEQFMPSQLSDAAAANAKKYGNSQGTTRQPFYELSRAGQSVLPSTIPDSGTAGRWLIPAVVAGSVGGGSYATREGDAADRAPGSLGTAALAATVAAAPYSSTARKIIQRALLGDRGKVDEKVGQFLIDNARIAGLLARPGAIVASQ